MELESISVVGQDANQSGVGKKFLIISISLTVLLNLSIAIWFFMNAMGRFLVNEILIYFSNSFYRNYL